MAIAELSACMKEKEKKIMRKVKKAAGILLALTLAAAAVLPRLRRKRIP